MEVVCEDYETGGALLGFAWERFPAVSTSAPGAPSLLLGNVSPPQEVLVQDACY